MTDYQPQTAPASNAGQGLAIASMVLGILSLLTAWIPIIGIIAWILAPLGLIFGFISVGKPAGKGFAITGLITSGLGLLICIAWATIFGAALNQAAKEGAFDQPAATYESAPAAPAPTPPSN